MGPCMGHTFWGRSGCTASIMGDGISISKAIKTGLDVVNFLLLLIADILAGYSFNLLRELFGFTSIVAMVAAILVVFVASVTLVYKLWRICNSEEDQFTLTVQGTWTKVSAGRWIQLGDEEVTDAMLSNDHYKQVKKGGGGGVITAVNRLASRDPGVFLFALRYITSVIRNPQGPKVFAWRDDTKEWLFTSSAADVESAACCDTDSTGCFICCTSCNFKYKSFSAQANLAFIGFTQFCFTTHAVYGVYQIVWSGTDYDPTPLLTATGVEVLFLILSAFFSFLLSTDFKCCFCGFNVDRHCRHSGPYIDLLNEIVIAEFNKKNVAVTEPPTVTPEDNAIRGHPKQVKDYMRVKCGSEIEARTLRELLSQHHERLYAKAFPSSPSAPLALTGAQIKLLDQFYEEIENRRLAINLKEDGNLEAS